jgi:phospholipase C
VTTPPIGRREVLQGIAAGAGAVVLGGVLDACSSSSSDGARSTTTRPRTGGSTTTTTRSGKPLGPDDRPDPSKPEGIDTMPQIEHIIIYMQENHSYDNVFGMLKRGDGFKLDRKGRPTNSLPDAKGKKITVFHEPDTSNSRGSAGQNWKACKLEFNNGKNDGYARLSTDSMAYYDRTDLPFYYGLAETFVVCDRWFCSAPAQTYPNRRFLTAATSVGITQTDIQEVLATRSAPNGLIFDRLNDHKISWKDYAFDIPDILLFPDFQEKNKDKVHTIGEFLTDCKDGTLPAVSIVSPGNTSFSEENQDSQRGEAYSALLINAVMQGKKWESTVMFFMYDEHGGLYDHVPPPKAITPDDIPLRLKPDDPPGVWDRYGPRVPAVVISPFAKKDYVSSVVHDHTSVLKFIETKYNLGALTRRDANADDLLDTLDFSSTAFKEPPELPKPALSDAAATSKFEPGAPPLPTPT